MLDCLRSEHRFNRQVRTEYMIMVVGIPNVGKSSGKTISFLFFIYA